MRRVLTIVAIAIAFAATAFAATSPASAESPDYWLKRPHGPAPQANTAPRPAPAPLAKQPNIAPRFVAPYHQQAPAYARIHPTDPAYTQQRPQYNYRPRNPQYAYQPNGPRPNWYHHRHHPRFWAVPVPVPVPVGPSYTYQNDDDYQAYTDDNTYTTSTDDYTTSDDGNCYVADRNVYDYDQNGRQVMVKRKVQVCD